MLRSAWGNCGLEVKGNVCNDSFSLKLFAFSMHSSHYRSLLLPKPNRRKFVTAAATRLVLAGHISVHRIMLTEAETAVDPFEQPVPILSQVAVFLVVLHHIGDDSPAATREGIPADFGPVFDADAVVETRFSLSQAVQ